MKKLLPETHGTITKFISIICSEDIALEDDNSKSPLFDKSSYSKFNLIDKIAQHITYIPFAFLKEYCHIEKINNKISPNFVCFISEKNHFIKDFILAETNLLAPKTQYVFNDKIKNLKEISRAVIPSIIFTSTEDPILCIDEDILTDLEKEKVPEFTEFLRGSVFNVAELEKIQINRRDLIISNDFIFVRNGALNAENRKKLEKYTQEIVIVPDFEIFEDGNKFALPLRSYFNVFEVVSILHFLILKVHPKIHPDNIRLNEEDTIENNIGTQVLGNYLIERFPKSKIHKMDGYLNQIYNFSKTENKTATLEINIGVNFMGDAIFTSRDDQIHAWFLADTQTIKISYFGSVPSKTTKITDIDKRILRKFREINLIPHLIIGNDVSLGSIINRGNNILYYIQPTHRIFEEKL